jgi:hypothetical protein
MMRGVNPAAVQRILRHRDPIRPDEIYGHLAPGYLRGEIDKLSFGLPSGVNRPLPGADSSSFATPLLPSAEEGLLAAEAVTKSPMSISDFVERATGIEPATLSLGS